MDLDDLEHNTRDGLHAASLAGTWIALVPGLAGLRERDGTLAFSPQLPGEISRLALTISVQRRRLNVAISPDATTYRLLEGEPLLLFHEGKPATVSTTVAVSRPNRKTPTREAPTQPPGRAPRHLRAGP